MMFQQYLKGSTDLPETFLGGPLLPAFTRRLIPLEVDQLLAPGTRYDNELSHASLEDLEAFVDEGTAFWIEGNSERARKRRFGCWLICVMPHDGLDEALSWLAEANDFYANAPSQNLLEAPGPKIMSGEYLPKKERAPLAIEE